MILAIDPGNFESAYAVLDNNLKPIEFAKVKNELLLGFLYGDRFRALNVTHFAIETVASYGMAVGKEVFETCIWIGRFFEVIYMNYDNSPVLIYRREEKINLCGSMKAKDANIRQALIDRFGVVGTKKNPGWFYGFSGDIWQAYAVGVTYYDMYVKGGDST
jgi:hypothetical protein